MSFQTTVPQGLASRIPGCFGVNDLIFAGHAMDEGRAEAVRDDPSYSRADKIQACEDYLKSRKVSQAHFETQMQSVRDFF